MGKRFSLIIGILLILMGSVALLFNVLAPTLGLTVWAWGTWRLWPLLILSGGVLFAITPLLAFRVRGLGALFIPGMVILATGAILMYTSVSNDWGAWVWLWPVEVLGLAAGFLLAAIWMRVNWLLLPAIVIGTNGLMFQYCAMTGNWGLWAVLWTFEPLSIGLAFLVINLKQRSLGLLIAAGILCGFGAIALIGMTAIFPSWWMFNIVGSAVLVLLGFVVLINSLVRHPVKTLPDEPAEQVAA